MQLPKPERMDIRKHTRTRKVTTRDQITVKDITLALKTHNQDTKPAGKKDQS